MVCGEPGAGKTTPLDHLAGHAGQGRRIARAAGDGAGLRRAAPAVRADAGPGRAAAGPAARRAADRVRAQGGPPPGRFLVGLAVLGLLSEAAGDKPLVCVVDDRQWLDRASAQAPGFAARRLAADPAGLVLAAGGPGQDLAGLPELAVRGLAE